MRLHPVAAAALSLALIGFAAGAQAAPCKDAKGKFVKCPPVAAAPVRCKDAKGKFIKCPPVVVRCKDSKGQFAKCGTPGASPA